MNINRSQLGLKIVRRKRRTATADQTGEKLLEVAGPIFAIRGYQAATIREICAIEGPCIFCPSYRIRFTYGDVWRGQGQVAGEKER